MIVHFFFIVQKKISKDWVQENAEKLNPLVEEKEEETALTRFQKYALTELKRYLKLLKVMDAQTTSNV